MPGIDGGFAAQAADHVGDVCIALLARLQIDQKAPAVQRDVVAVHSDERGKALYGRIGENGRGQGLLALRHGRVGDRFAGLRHALNQSGVLIRKEALRNQHVENHRERERPGRDVQRRALMIEHPGQSSPVPFDQRREPAPRVGLRPRRRGRSVLEQLCAQHGHERQRYHRGYQNRDGERHRELAKQPADHILHEQQRNQHRDQRHGE